MLAYMADWRQIQARIRKAKASTDAPVQLAELYERTHDGMVAFELAHWYERAGDNTQAIHWYTLAAGRFRRAQWRTKSEEALTRLGAPIPVYETELTPESKPSETRSRVKTNESSAAPEDGEPPLADASEKKASEAGAVAEDDQPESLWYRLIPRATARMQKTLLRTRRRYPRMRLRPLLPLVSLLPRNAVGEAAVEAASGAPLARALKRTSKKQANVPR